ncbi:MAG TPA: universal stress protein [Rhodoblastus sp.]|nr:universal stress protein [Rhodoblastus sp.]
MRHLLVHLDSSAQTKGRLDLAITLAKRMGSRLVGAFAQTQRSISSGVAAAWPPAEYVAARNAAEAAFTAATAGLVDRAFMDINRGEESDIIVQAIDVARHFDLVILGQPAPDSHAVPSDLIERVVIDSGRPALVVPYAGHFADVGHRPMFAWNDSREAGRAFVDGIRVTAKDANAVVVSISRPGDPAIEYRKGSLELAVAHLKAHGIAAKADQALSSDIGLMDALLNEAADCGADLLVLGAFGGQGYPRFSRGSGSRFMLKHMTLPVLLSH